MFADVLPVECDIRILRLNLSKDLGLERAAADTHATRRPEDIQDARPLTMPLAIEMHQIRGLVSTLVPDHSQKRHSALLALLRPGW